LYHMQDYEYALRCFEKVRSFSFSVDTSPEAESLGSAVLQNNIGCCLMMLNRNQEAVRYFKLSHELLDLRVGCFDERTLVVQQNGSKNRKAYL